MKKFSMLLVVLFAITGELRAQHLSVNVFGGYTFQDKMNFGDAYAKIKDGFMWGGSVEGVNSEGGGLELLYQYQSTNIPVYSYTKGGDVLLNPDNNSAVISYLLLNGNRYFKNGSNIEPYFGAGLGVSFISAKSGNGSTTSFAWDLKGGVKIKVSQSVGIKIGAQLLNSLHQSGTDYYYYYGVPYAYSTYASIWQFGFTGGITYDFGH